MEREVSRVGFGVELRHLQTLLARIVEIARRIDTTEVAYLVAVSDHLMNWDRTKTQVEQVGDSVRNDDGASPKR
jgi:hypothetical protein